jgi:hypothetical protein
MAFPSRTRKETHDFNTPPELSGRTSTKGAQHRTTIRSYRGSISNSSAHTINTAATRKDLFNNSDSEKGPGGVPSISDSNSSYSIQKRAFRFRNQSQSTVGTNRQAGSVRSSTATSTLRGTRLYNIPSSKDEDESPPLP